MSNTHVRTCRHNFYASPLYAIDSDATMRSIMDFLTIKPGDNYTPAQLAFCARYAEALNYEVWARFGDD